MPEITPRNRDEVLAAVSGSAATDVTGGMSSKVRQMLQLTGDVHGLLVDIFSARNPGDLAAAFGEDRPGTRIHCADIA